MPRLRLPLKTLVLALALPLVTASVASAHHLLISAQGVCVTNRLKISFTVTSWSVNAGEGEHPNVVVTFNSVPKGTYALVYAGGNPITFSDSLDAPAGTVAVTATAEGPWGNGFPGGASVSIEVTMPTDCGSSTPSTGRFTGGGKSIDAATGLKVTKGFTIHCDLILSNNLEINWPGVGRQNQFHMEDHTFARCSDDPTIDQRPPAAPVDRIDGVGTGRFNGTPGYTVVFTLIDAGEPGTSDWIGFRIFHTISGVEVLNLPLQHIVGGNVQAHFDQPHKK